VIYHQDQGATFQSTWDMGILIHPLGARQVWEAAKRCWKLASYEVAGIAELLILSHKGRWDSGVPSGHIIVMILSGHFVAG